MFVLSFVFSQCTARNHCWQSASPLETSAWWTTTMTSLPPSSALVWKVCGCFVCASVRASWCLSLFHGFSHSLVYAYYLLCRNKFCLWYHGYFFSCDLCCRCGGPMVLTGRPPCSGRDGEDHSLPRPLLSSPDPECHCQVLQRAGWTHLHTGHTSTGDQL